jgi:transposase
LGDTTDSVGQEQPHGARLQAAYPVKQPAMFASFSTKMDFLERRPTSGKSHIQALDRLDPVLPLSPGRAERHGFEYYRHGTLSLHAAFNTKTGEVLGRTASRHTSAEFVAFLSDIVVNQPRRKEIHVIADNLSTHKTAQVAQFLTDHPKVHLHFTPTYSSWLNQVELWFAKIERDVIARGVFTSVPDLKRKLMRYIRRYNEVPKTVKWKYFDPKRRIDTSTSAVTVH